MGALAGVLAAAVLALAIMIWLFLRLRRRHRRALRELDAYRAAGLPPPGGSGGNTTRRGGKNTGLEKVMSEKPRAQPGSTVANRSSVDLMDTNSDYDIAFELITPTHDGARNPFEDPTNVTAAGLLSARRAQLQSRDKNRLSTTSLVSDVPSAGARSTGAHSAFSTEFYHRAQTRTIPLRHSAGTDSDSASGTMSLSGASSTDDGSIATVLVPITRVSTTSSGTHGALTSSGSSDRPTGSEDDDGRSFSNTSYTEPESWSDADEWRSRSRSRQSDDSRHTAASGFSAWGRRLMGRD